MQKYFPLEIGDSEESKLLEHILEHLKWQTEVGKGWEKLGRKLSELTTRRKQKVLVFSIEIVLIEAVEESGCDDSVAKGKHFSIGQKTFSHLT